MKLRPVSLAILLLAASVAQSAQAQERRSYIVQLVDKPAAAYTGQIDGLAATKPAPGARINVGAADVQAYLTYLDTKQAAVAGTVSAAQITHQYNVVFNGFSALLTDDEVRALKKNSGVANISADSILQLDTSYTPTFLGLDKPGGIWEQLGGTAHAGEDVILGIVDSGIWPENTAFADRLDESGVPSHSGNNVVYGAPPASWHGECQTGEGFSADNCNNKLIGARYYRASSAALHWTEFRSPRDSVAGLTGHGGHGTHTASTAGGNHGALATSNGVSLGKASGMAPRARIAAYKVCWTDGATGKNGCATADSVAAIDQAVKDGVNVINFSIGPNAGGGAFDEATEQAFLGAANAGVFVATSGGNSGPSTPAPSVPAPVSHISPWLATVANSTHNRLYAGNVILSNGTRLEGASSNANTPALPLIRSRDAGLAGISPTDVNLLRCYGAADATPAYLDPAKVAGKVLVCDRGGNVLVNKSANAKTAGAAGVVIANVAGGANTIVNQAHVLSTVHLAQAQGDALKAFMASSPDGKAALGEIHTVADTTVQAPIVSDRSSRGPNVANANILKPDLSAPGTNILAGVTADLTPAQRDAVAAGGVAPTAEWDFYSGTSMASPHVAGVAALLRQQHPDWSPAAIKSALMTTAFSTLPDGLNGSVSWDATAKNSGQLPWGQGAGHIAPNSAADPGLVYDLSEIDYARFLCGLNIRTQYSANCATTGSIAAYNLNLASLTAANVLGTQTLTRTVTNVGSSSAVYNASASLPGYTVAVTPSSLSLAPGAKAQFQVKLTRTTAPLDTWVYGALSWTDGTHTVRSPLTARGSILVATPLVKSEAATGSKVVTLGTGFAGPLVGVKSGLIEAVRETRTIGQANNSTASASCKAGGATGVNVHNVVIPAGTLAARFATYDAETTGGANTDMDMEVYNAANVLVGSSGNQSSNEQVELRLPAAGTYKVCLIGYAPQNGQANYTLSSWVLAPGLSNGGFKALMPGTAFMGGTASVALSWSNLAEGKRHLGAVGYQVAGVVQGITVVEVNTDDPVPLAQDARGDKPVLAD
ncbi:MULTISPECIES: S8 family peptidase [unclassified Janthinobacterium]|uniref:S8 family peptidase n=1 Tax=unclassified Janthinobacterium TaxID=2610881 RepID=UPI00087E625D|nr:MULTISPECIES: S8 family peptidase [unclassified Janthinobacterium]SDA84766.1 Peptidase inhibitor I9 [Janthinobacterium sp. 551a]SFB65603.1 Peptidase inhibitor I9 [Janthinobacterium sp. 344]